MKQLKPLGADRQGQCVVVNLIRAPLTDGINIVRIIELLALNDAVKPMRCLITTQPAQHISMSDDARPRNAPCVSLLVNNLDAACMVNMAMGVDHGVNGALVPAPNSGKGLACCVRFSRVYQHQPGG